MYSVPEITKIVSEAIQKKVGFIHLPKESQPIRITKTLRAFYHKGIVCAHCNLIGTSFYVVTQQNKSHLRLFGSKNDRLVLMTSDHIIPYSLGGSNNIRNIQILCAECNQEKSNEVDKKIFRSAGYLYKSIRDFISNKYPNSQLKEDFKNEFNEIITNIKSSYSSDYIDFYGEDTFCGSKDEILQLLYYIREKYKFKIKLSNLRRVPTNDVEINSQPFEI